MPFKSEAQRRFMWANHPAIAREFAAHTPKNTNLPNHLANAAKRKLLRKKVKKA